MELEKYITAAKKAINEGYFGIQDALMKYDEALEELKMNGWKYSEKQYSELYQGIVATFNTETQSAISDCKTAVQEQKNAYMKEVSAYYAPDGSRIDLNDMNLIKSGLPMTVDEVLGMIDKHVDNPTMLRIIEKFAIEQRMIDKIRDYNINHARALVRAKNAGKTEEKIFDTFVHLASMGMNHPDKSFTLYQATRGRLISLPQAATGLRFACRARSVGGAFSRTCSCRRRHSSPEGRIPCRLLCAEHS